MFDIADPPPSYEADPEYVEEVMPRGRPKQKTDAPAAPAAPADKEEEVEATPVSEDGPPENELTFKEMVQQALQKVTNPKSNIDIVNKVKELFNSTMTTSQVAQIKNNLNKETGSAVMRTPRAQKSGLIKAPKTNGTGDLVSIITDTKALVERAGGFEQMRELLDALER